MTNKSVKIKLGQHFLINKQIINKIITIINPNHLDYFLEIGSGYGALTFPFIKYQKFSKLFLVELDNKLFNFLKKNITSSKINIINCNILILNLNQLCDNYKINKFIIIGNIPFYISKLILFFFIKFILKIKNIVIVVQEEVGKKLIANVNNKNYGRLSIIMQLFFIIDIHLFIPATEFKPIPKINTVLISLIPKNIYKIIYFKQIINIFYYLINIIFNNKRKIIYNSLKKIIDLDNITLFFFKIILNLRPVNLTSTDYFYLAYCIFYLNLLKKFYPIINNK